MRLRRELGRRDTKDRGNVDGRAAAEAIAAEGKPVVVAMLMERRFTVVVGMLFGAGLVCAMPR
jgi:hypothetical protein